MSIAVLIGNSRDSLQAGNIVIRHTVIASAFDNKLLVPVVGRQGVINMIVVGNVGVGRVDFLIELEADTVLIVAAAEPLDPIEVVLVAAIEFIQNTEQRIGGYTCLNNAALTGLVLAFFGKG